jgi:hypothetical protein
MASIRNTIFLELRIIKEYWQAISVATTIIFFGVYFYLENKDSREEVKELIETNKQLKDRISRLEGQIDVINSNMVLFVEKNPGLTSYRLEMLEEQMDVRDIIDGLNRYRQPEIKIIQVPGPTQVHTIKELVPVNLEPKKSEEPQVTAKGKRKKN